MTLYSIADALLIGALFCALGSSAAAALRADDRIPFPSSSKSAVLTTVLTAQGLVALLLTICCAVVLYAFITFDFRLEYVVHYSDRTLPLFYRVTALWAGRSGSMLFWAWSVAVSGTIFSVTPAYRRLGTRTKFWFWAFFLGIMAFFLLILTAWSSPFELWKDSFGRPAPPPIDGYGLNPLLQNPGMIFHPPLLFLGYGGFVVPGCLALAQTVGSLLRSDAPSFSRAGAVAGPGIYAERGEMPADSPGAPEPPETPWGEVSRPFTLVAWLLLTAGIVLGAWWAYMELGWGGYWAWDPVENASLIPWLTATAYLHTAVIESRRGKLRRVNVFLMALTTISAFFATYLVRSGVIESLHAFGSSDVGAPLLIFVSAFLALALFIAVASPHGKNKELEEFFSKEGLLVLAAWVLIALSLIILIATLWPVIMNGVQWIAPFISTGLAMRVAKAATGLDTAFYNRTCLPLFTLLSLLLMVCPFRKWRIKEASFSSKTGAALFLFVLGSALLLLDGRFQPDSEPARVIGLLALYAPLLLIVAAGLFFFPLGRDDVTQPRIVQAVLAFMVLPALLLFGIGMRRPTALIAAVAAVTGLAGIAAYFGASPKRLRLGPTLAAHGVHIGILLMFLGVALSGPYQAEHTLLLQEKQPQPSGEYVFVLDRLFTDKTASREDNDIRFHYAQADVQVYKNGVLQGTVQPQRRIYAKFEKQTFAEVSTLFSLGNEVYATLLGIDDRNRATVLIHINPLVNWIWIGGVLACLFPLLGLWAKRREGEAEETRPEAYEPQEPA